MLARFSTCLLLMSLAATGWAGAPAPPTSEAELVSRVQEVRKSKAAVMPDDNFPRTLRLADALQGLGNFYEEAGRTEDADKAFAEMFAILSVDKSEAGVDLYRYHSDAVGKTYLGRGDFATAKKHIDVALRICRTNDRERSALSSVLTTLAAWHSKQKQWPEAEAALLEAVSLRGTYAYGEQIALIDVYLESGKREKAAALIDEAQKSKYASSDLSFRRVRLLRANGKTTEADALEAEAKLKQKAEREIQEASQ